MQPSKLAVSLVHTIAKKNEKVRCGLPPVRAHSSGMRAQMLRKALNVTAEIGMHITMILTLIFYKRTQVRFPARAPFISAIECARVCSFAGAALAARREARRALQREQALVLQGARHDLRQDLSLIGLRRGGPSELVPHATLLASETRRQAQRARESGCCSRDAVACVLTRINSQIVCPRSSLNSSWSKPQRGMV